MPLPSAEPTAFRSQLEKISASLLASDVSTQKLADSLTQLVNILASDSQDNKLDEKEATQIGDYGMQILASCSRHAADKNDTELQRETGSLAISVAIWVCDHGGEITALEPVVDTLAWLANYTKDQNELAMLSDIIGKIIDACSLSLRSDLESMNPGRPWRVINMNYGIVATRSHNPEIMEAAFQTLIKNLPRDAPNFFTEGMSEMERLGYPDHVRKVMERYYEQWNEPHVIH